MNVFWNDLDAIANSPALHLPNGLVLTYGQLVERADAIVAQFAPRSLVAIECENHVDCVATYIGCLRRGVVPLLVDALLDQSLRDALYVHFQIEAVWTPSSHQAEGWHRLRDGSPVLHPDLALLLSTSGSTGSPRLVRLSQRNLQSNAKAIAEYLEITSSERPITTLPMHYSYGLSVINSHLLCGACILLTPESITGRGFWTFFREAQATSFAGVPAVYEMLRRLRFERMELPSLRSMSQAGGRLATEQIAWFAQLAQSRNQKFTVMYGQTEATARISYVPAARALDKAGSIGQAIPGGVLFLQDSSGQRIDGVGETGELVYQGDNVMLGYAESVHDLQQPDVLQGTLQTGDLAKQDEDGFFYIVGRLKRFIKIHGNRIGLDEVEHQIRTNGLDAYATGRDDLLMVALADVEYDPALLAQEIIAKYQLHHSTVRVLHCDDVPRSSAGKVQYQVLLDLLESKLQAG